MDRKETHEAPSLAEKLLAMMATGGGKISFLQGYSERLPTLARIDGPLLAALSRLSGFRKQSTRSWEGKVTGE